MLICKSEKRTLSSYYAGCQYILILALTFLFFSGCATTHNEVPDIRSSSGVSWSIKSSQDEMIVAVSPARQTMQIGGLSAAALGAGVDAVANAKYRRAIRDVLEGYEPGKVYEEHLSVRLEKSAGSGIVRVSPFSMTSEYSDRRIAEKARYKEISKNGSELLLDLKMTYGIFGTGGTLIVKLDGALSLLPKGETMWKNSIVVSNEPILASSKLTDPTKRLGPSLSSPRLRADKDAIGQWTEDGGEELRRHYEATVEGAVSALLCDLDLENEAIGEYFLGKLSMNRKDFKEAEVHYQKALELDPELIDARNGSTVNLAHQGKVDEAIESAKALTVSNPDYGPAWHNIAWWYAVEKKDSDTAKPYYEKAIELGMPGNKKIEK